MADASWPVGLLEYVLQDGYKEKLPDNKLESQMEYGMKKMRRRQTANFIKITFKVQLDADQKVIFETFYNTTLLSGTLPFDWVHPATRAACTMRFVQPAPEYEVIGGYWHRVLCNVEIVP